MKPQDTLTYKDIIEIPELLEEFSRRAPKLGAAALKSKDGAVYLAGRGSSGNATLFAKYIWEVYSGVITNFIHPHSIFEARVPLRFRGQAVWAFSQSGKSEDIVAVLKKLMSWGAKGVAVTNEADLKSMNDRHMNEMGAPDAMGDQNGPQLQAPADGNDQQMQSADEGAGA